MKYLVRIATRKTLSKYLGSKTVITGAAGWTGDTSAVEPEQNRPQSPSQGVANTIKPYPNQLNIIYLIDFYICNATDFASSNESKCNNIGFASSPIKHYESLEN